MYKWQKSSFSASNNGNCVEVATGENGAIVMRESDDPNVIVTTDRAKWAAFIAGVKAGEFDHFA
ncbi:DUF397 domain-containing protein [Kitasatospora acidiphila]|uniref:DUF397 domain-containing protein n=1 Tax=Kitasatospora acidiphila TaxID=2567942 RepID=A0A540W4P2_9ACTN|nr:DUF397 domain-containing protein [Kitasatospora acidiphila]TQF03943.1 DUF397 domain-containing protein [Kitasatospora acidiphila]